MSFCEKCIVRKFSGLKTLNPEELEQISKNKTSLSFQKGELIFDEGEYLKGVYCVRHGISKLTKLSSNGKDQIIKFVSNGEVLGQRSTIANEPTNLKAIALNDMEVCFIPKNYFLENIKKNPRFSMEMLQDLAHELKEADDVIVNMSQKPVKQRIAETILHLENSFGLDEEGFLLIRLSREDISNIVGTATESCIRLLSTLKKEGLISTSGKRIMITDKETLQQVAEGLHH
ncbi:MAG: Crp/Fnr family transcriptional regulator [Flavobacteriaceae bacterium]|nr:Crp/Fnr family transcriptional regulator [Flavobacteriaceae bacterium]